MHAVSILISAWQCVYLRFFIFWVLFSFVQYVALYMIMYLFNTFQKQTNLKNENINNKHRPMSNHKVPAHFLPKMNEEHEQKFSVID